MPADDTRDAYSGLIVPDPRIALWESETTVESAGAHVGHPTPTAPGRLVVRARRRELAAALEAPLELQVADGGLPGRALGAASFTWRYEGDTDDEWRDHDAPTSLAGRSLLSLVGSNACVVRLPTTGRVLVYFEVAAGGTRTMEIRYRDPGDPGWTYNAAGVAASDLDGSLACYPAACATPDGRVLLYLWRHDAATGQVTIAGYEALEGGLSLVRMGDTVTATTDTVVGTATGTPGELTAVHRLAVAQRDGQVLLLASVRYVLNGRTYTRDTYRQLASVDGGYHFELVGEWADTEDNGGRYPALWSDVDGFHLVHVALGSGNAGAYSSRLCDAEHRAVASAFAPLESAVAAGIGREGWGYTTVGGSASVPQSTVSSGAVCACLDDAGVAWVHGVADGNLFDGRTVVSYDRGRTWLQAEAQPTSPDREGWWSNGDDAVHPFDLASVWSEGRVLLICNAVTVVAATSGHLQALELGGYTTEAMPRVGLGGWEAGRGGWTETWIPLELPSNAGTGWARSSTPSTSESLATGHLVQSASAASQFILDEWDLSTISPATGLYGRFRLKTSSTRSAVADHFQCGVLEARLSNGTNGVGIRINVEAGAIHVAEIDGVSSYHQLATAAVDATGGLEVYWAIHDDAATVLYRQIGGADRKWIPLWDAPGLFDLGLDYPDGHVWRGSLLDAGQSVTWSECHLGIQLTAAVAQGRASNISAGVAKRGRRWSTRGVEIVGGVDLVASGGPARMGDAWRALTAYDHGPERTLAASPRTSWISSGTATPAAWTWLAYSLASERTWAGTDLLGVALFGTTLPWVRIDLHDGTTWITVVDEAAGHTGLDYTRDGDAVRASGVAASDLLLRDGELEPGAWFAMGTTGRAVRQTHGGRWAAGSKRPVLLLDDVDAGDPASGADGQIVPAQIVALISLAGGRWKGVRIGVPDPAQVSGIPTPPAGSWQVGTVQIGPVVVWPERYGWGRTIEVEADVDTYTLRGGATRTRRNGAPGRLVEVGWTDGVDTLGASLDTDDPGVQYVDLANGDPVALSGTTPWVAEGVVRWLDGPDRAATYLPTIVQIPEPDGYVLLTRRHESMLGRIAGTVRLETVQGDEGTDEVFRIARIPMMEER